MTTTNSHAGSPESPVEGLYEQFVGMVPEIREELHRLDSTRERIQKKHAKEREDLKGRHDQELSEHDYKRRRLARLLKELGEEEAKPKRPSKKGTRPGNAILLQIINGILDHGDEHFSTLGIHEQIGATWGSPASYTAFNYLRQAQFIGKVGLENRPHGRTLFRVLDRHVGEEMKRIIESSDGPNLPSLHHKGQPSGTRLTRVIDAIHALDTSRFAAREVQHQLGMASPKTAYEMLGYLRKIGFVEKVGNRKTPDGHHQEQVFEIKNEDALTGVLEGTNGEEETVLVGSQSN